MKKKIIPLISIALSILLTISCLSLSASASDIEPRVPTGSVPSDLTGYIVTVPNGWTATFALANPEANYPVLPGAYTFTASNLVASLSGDIDVSASLYYGTMDSALTVSNITISAGEATIVWLNGVYSNREGYDWVENIGGVLCPVLGSTLTINETVYSQALLDFLALNTDYEEVNAPEEPIENITLSSGVYIFDSVLQVPSNTGVYPIQFRSNDIAFYGMSLDTVLSYGDSGLAAFAPAYTYSSNTWTNTSYRFILLESDQLVDRRLGDYILAESKFLTLEDYLFIYNNGYDSGYDKGYSDGKNLTDSNSFIGGFFGDFFGGIRDSLDSLVLYQSTDSPIPINVTVWGVLSTIVMLFIVLFVLKLIAGG